MSEGEIQESIMSGNLFGNPFVDATNKKEVNKKKDAKEKRCKRKKTQKKKDAKEKRRKRKKGAKEKKGG